MRNKRIAAILMAGLLAVSSLQTGGVPAFAAETDTVSEDAADPADLTDADPLPEEETPIVSEEGAGDEDGRIPESIPGDDIDDVAQDISDDGSADAVFPKPAADWYESYEYEISDGILWLKVSKGGLTGNITIPASVKIDNVTYRVGLQKAKGEYYGGLWYPDRETLTGIRFEDGVYAGDTMDSMFLELKKLKDLDLSGLDTSDVTDMRNLCYNCEALENIDLTGPDTSKVKDMSHMFDGCGSLEELDVSGFDTSKAETMECMFTQCRGLKELDVSGFDTSNVKSFSQMFFYCSSLESLDVSHFDTQSAENLSKMFSGCSKVKKLEVGGFRTGKVTDMSKMFATCSALEEADVSDFDTSMVTAMNSMFYDCHNLKVIDVSGFDTGSLRGQALQLMFRGCSTVKVLDVSNFDTSNVTNFGGMFSGCSEVEELDVSGFDTAKSNYFKDMFAGCTSLETLDVRSFDFTAYNTYDSQYPGSGMCTNFIGKLDESYDRPENGVKDLWLPLKAMKNYDFTEDPAVDPHSALEKIHYAGTREQWEALHNTVPEGVDVVYGAGEPEPVVRSDWYKGYAYTVSSDGVKNEIRLHHSLGGLTAGRISIPAAVYYDAEGDTEHEAGYYDVVIDPDENEIVTDPLSDDYYSNRGFWDRDKDKITSIRFRKGVTLSGNCAFLFSNMSKLEYVDLRGADASNVTDMSCFFNGCPYLTKVNMMGLDTTSVTSMRRMFSGCQQIREVFLDGINTSNVTDMSNMFFFCWELEKLDLSGFDTSNVINMQRMFQSDSKLRSITLGPGFSTSLVRNMSYMFSECVELRSIDLSGFDTSSVTEMGGMFKWCSRLQSVSLNSFRTSQCIHFVDMFYGCTNLRIVDARSFDFSKCDSVGLGDFIRNSGIIDLYLPEDFVGGYDFGNREYSGIRDLKHIYYAGNEEQWAGLGNTVPEGVEVIFDYGRLKPVIELPKVVEELTLGKKILKVKKGQTYRIRYSILPEDAEDKTVTWSSRAPAEVAVDPSTGLITPLKAGAQVMITATAADRGTISDVCEVRVDTESSGPDPIEPISHDYVENLSLNLRDVTLLQGRTVQLKPAISPSNAMDTGVIYASDDETVAAVSDDGLITAVGEGVTIIRATAAGSETPGAVRASCIVRVIGSQIVSGDDADKPAASDDAFWIAGIDNGGYDHTGGAIRPAFRLYYGNTLLKAGTDYKVVYKNNKAVKASVSGGSVYGTVNELPDRKLPYVLITLKGNYSGKLLRTFTIRKKSLDDEDISIVEPVAVATGRTQKLKPLVYRGKTLVNAKEYELTGEGWLAGGYKDEGVYEVTISAKRDGHYTGTRTAHIYVNAAGEKYNLAKLSFRTSDGRSSYVYTREAIEPAYVMYNGRSPVEGLLEGTDYKVTYLSNTAVGKAAVRFEALPASSKCYGTKTVTFKIVKPAAINLKSAQNAGTVSINLLDETGKPLPDDAVTYVKGGVKPKAEVRVGGVLLKEGVDYKLTYGNNKKAADVSVAAKKRPILKVTGKGAYKGMATLYFGIRRADLSALSLTADDVVLTSDLKKQKPYAYQKTSWTLKDKNGKALAAGTDFVKFTKGKASAHGKYYIADAAKLAPGSVVTLKLDAKSTGNYTGSIYASYRVIESTKSIKKARVTLTDDAKNRLQYRQGMPVTLTEDDLLVKLGTATLTSDQYEIVGLAGNIAAGKKAKVTIRGKGEYGNMKTVTFTIAPVRYSKV